MCKGRKGCECVEVTQSVVLTDGELVLTSDNLAQGKRIVRVLGMVEGPCEG